MHGGEIVQLFENERIYTTLVYAKPGTAHLRHRRLYFASLAPNRLFNLD
jgi:hypothetical protein